MIMRTMMELNDEKIPEGVICMHNQRSKQPSVRENQSRLHLISIIPNSALHITNIKTKIAQVYIAHPQVK